MINFLKRAMAQTFGASIFIQLCTVIQGIILARSLGPVGRGEFVAITMWPLVFSSVGLLGCHITFARLSAKAETHAKQKIINSAILSTLFLSVFSSISGFFLLDLLIPEIRPDILDWARIFLLFIPLNQMYMVLNAIDQGAGNFKKFNLFRSLFYPIYVSGLLILLLLGWSEVGLFVLIFILAQGIVTLLRIISSRKRNAQMGTAISLQSVLWKSRYFGAAGFVEVVSTQLDKAILLWFMGPEQLGYYSVALTVSMVLDSFTKAAGMVVFSYTAKARNNMGDDVIIHTFRYSMIFWFAGGSLLALLLPLLLPLVYGGDFDASVRIAQFLIIGSAFGCLTEIPNQALKAAGIAFAGVKGRVAGSIVLFVTCFYTVQWWGTYGMCLGYGVSQLVYLLVVVHVYNLKNKQPITMRILKPGAV